MSRPPCKFFNTPGGCRRGQACTFAHTSVSRTPPPVPSNTGSPSRQREQPNLPKSPPGVCNFFWTSGECNREFACRYRHIRDAPNNTPPTPSTTSTSAAVDTIAPFLTQGGLAKLNGTGTDVFFANPPMALTPTDVHNHMKRFLFDDFRFRKTFEIYGFLTPLMSANTSNQAWTSEDGQLLLTSIAAGNGLLRIGDILRWSPITTIAGSNPTILSFQRGYLPLLRFLSSDIVVKSTLNHRVNALYMGVMVNFDGFCETVERCMQAIMEARSFKDPNGPAVADPIGSQVIASLASLLFECLTRFKNAAAIYPRLIPLVRNLENWTNIWVEGVSSSPPTFDNPFKGVPNAARDHIVTHLQARIARLVTMANREQNKLDRADRKSSLFRPSDITSTSREGITSALRITYEGPGELRPQGRRHDNDFLYIQDIRIAPTHEELVSRTPPFLPANFYEAPHPFEADSMERLLDVQFRLLREELTAPLRTSVQLVWDDLINKNQKTRLSDIMEKKGGKYRGVADAQNSIMFNMYTNVTFSSLFPDRRGISVGLSFDAPPGRARSPQAKARAAFWEKMSGKRLMQGGLIALIWKYGNEVNVHLGVLASSARDLGASSQKSDARVDVRVVFFDPAVEIRIFNILKDPKAQTGAKFLVEAPVMFEAVRPFLEALQVEPEAIPFKQYLVHRPNDAPVYIDPPKYAQVPGFTWQLASLFPPETGVTDLKMSVSDPDSILIARRELKRSRLDPSQAEAVVDALCREVTLIQGPPGTGKSYTGVELIRVLLQHTKPILMIAFTNHALDHMLTSVLDAGITTSIVRLGSRSADERISQYSIETLETVAGKSRLDKTFGQQYRELKDTEEKIRKLMVDFQRTFVASDEILQHLQIQYPEHFENVIAPPTWITTLQELWVDEAAGWEHVGRRGKHDEDDHSTYAYWLQGQDIMFLHRREEAETLMVPEQTPFDDNNSHNLYAALGQLDPGTVSDDSLDSEEAEAEEQMEGWQRVWNTHTSQEAQEKVVTPNAPQTQTLPVLATPAIQEHSDSIHLSDLRNPIDFFLAHGYLSIPDIPHRDRQLDDLLSDGEIWSMSSVERKRLHVYWTEVIREYLYQSHLDNFEDLRKKHADILKRHNEGRDETRRQLLRSVDIVGCTTTGAAKLTSLLRGLDPRIMLVEEAGQVLEAHVLGSLVPSVEHLILIGDPLQLRPTLNNYLLSMDSKLGRELYRLDMSLMERLSSSGIPMSRIDVQRRMRPAISDLVRKTLYPGLIDHDLVKSYPDIRGFHKNVFFLSHNHKENGGAEESASKYNTFEVEMIKDLVLYLLRQGCYSQEGDIVVLCAYLGQLARVRDALADQVAVVIDEQDQEALADHEENESDDQDTRVEHVRVSRRVRLRTVDNYQGEEAKIIILSLVRNAGEDPRSGSKPTIGFLRSDNRTNVALSRAKEGLFILGNAAQLASRSGMWRRVIEELEHQGSVGAAIPIACHRHPDTVEYISEPGSLPQFAPDGGCLEPCNSRLGCGHVCPHKCHPDDPKHLAVTCSQPCRKLCPRRHPCHKECSVPCGKCTFQVSDVLLPCGHTSSSVPCYLLDNLGGVLCTVTITKQLPKCEHTAQMACSSDPAGHTCTATCGGIMSCCGRDCNSRCHQCQGANTEAEGEPTIRELHVEHPCHKTLYCAHSCTKPCSRDHECITACRERCRQECPHARCNQYCSTPCAPCQEPCTWNCAHHTCPVPCGSVCARLPCDIRCEKILRCGHQCPSVCGEDCSIQACPSCASEQAKEQVVDLILYRTLGDVLPENETLDDLVITLPKCRHIFTVETLDGLCGMSDLYGRDENDKWIALKSSHNTTEVKKPPTCPTCRSVVTSPRYGRVFKSADLDILERNVISRMTQQLGRVQGSLVKASDTEAQTQAKLVSEAQKIEVAPVSHSKKARKACTDAREALLEERRDLPAPPESIVPDNDNLYLISPTATSAWRSATQHLLNIYTQIFAVAKTRSAHVNAWEAAFSVLYQQEMDAFTADPSRAPRRPKEHAMRMARIKVGQPQPRADKRFLVEAFWATLKVRFILADLAQIWSRSVSNKGEAYPPSEHQCWAIYGLFLLDSCIKDAHTAFVIAKESESRRQMTTTTLLIMRADLERFRFNLEMTKGSGTLKTERARLADGARSEMLKATRSTSATARDHLAVLPNDGQEWITNNFVRTAQTIIDEWQKVEKSIRAETFYEPVSLDEKMAVVKALNFSHTGHFYNCPNGHTFVITECGGAMETSRCPECNAVIGGHDHHLNTGNARATDFEDLAVQGGARRSPWAWGV